MSTETFNPQQLNEYVREILSPYLNGDYTLTPGGQTKVIQANADLDETYARANYLPVVDWCYRDIAHKLRLLPPREFGTLLDVCAGTGYVALNVMRHNLFQKCVALDINPSALKILEERARELDVSGIETQAGNIFETTWPDSSFDCVIGNAFLHHLPDTQSFFREMHRVLKPGGVLCLTGEPSISTMKWENLIPRFIKRMMGKKHWPKGEVPLTDIWQFEERPLTEALRAAGFSEVRITGFGLWSASIATVLDRLWVRCTGYTSPPWVRYIGYALRVFDFGPKGEPDQWAALAISARKHG